MVVFRVGAADAEFLEQEFTPELTQEDIVNLPNYSVYLKLMVDGVTSRPFSARTLPPFKVESSEQMEEKVIAESRKRYARPRYAVEEEISRWAGGIVGGGGAVSVSEGAFSAAAGGGGKFEVVCSACGKATTVPFKPEPGRPVYCQDCLKKIKAGELQPVRVPRAPTAREEAVHMADLSKLGIEFGGGGVPLPHPPKSEAAPEGERRERGGFKKFFKRREENTPPPQMPPLPSTVSGRRVSILRDTQAVTAFRPSQAPRGGEMSAEEEKEHELRLSELAPQEPKEAKKPSWDDSEPDIKGLQDALRDALGKLKE
jgi:CxxC-x17-CxxC domain-containing protein